MFLSFSPGSFLFVILVILNLFKSSNQNHAPRFSPMLHSNYFFPEFNSTKPGDILLWLNATDYDDSNLKFGIEGDFYNRLMNVRQIDGKHAQVIANMPFDRETQEKYEDIFFYVQDALGNKVYQSVRFVILDIDDNPPVFENIQYKIDVNENQNIGSSIFNRVEAYDLDGPLYNEFIFSLKSTDHEEKDMFQISKTNYVSSGRFRSSISLAKELDYEKSKSHVITVLANGLNSNFVTPMELIVNVLDFPDMPPEFSQSPYYVKIEEEMPVDTFVLQIYARDGDTGINNPCKYEIIYDNPAAEYFKLDSSTGILSIRNRIDLESKAISQLGGLLEFKVVAYEIGDENSVAQTQVTVAIVDLNDNNPTFDSSVYNLKISPYSVEGTSLTLIKDSIHIFDLDKGINGSFSLFVTKNINISDTYEVLPRRALNDANVVIKLKNSANLLRNMGVVEHYYLIAVDNGINGVKTYADLFITVETINIFAPEFESDVYMYYIDENSPFNTTVGVLKAYDNDTLDDYGLISYSLKNGQGIFQIEKVTGRIFTMSKNEKIELDRESLDTFHMSVDAVDGGGLRKSVQIVIRLNDVNDNNPQFIMSSIAKNKAANNLSLIGVINENSAKWIEPIRLIAVDSDDKKNGEIVYEIIDGDFLVDRFAIDNKTNSVVLKHGQTLDFEEIVELKKMKKYLKKRTTLIEAITYDEFLLAYDEIDINLVLRASDMGEPALGTVIVAKVIVKDVNDHRPIFPTRFYNAKVLETATVGDVIQVKAFDADAELTPNSEISYRIETGAKDKFYIDSVTGVVKISENANLDRDTFGSSYTLQITARDLGVLSENKPYKSQFSTRNSESTKNGSLIDSTCFLQIDIIDVNNKKPKFTENFKVNLKENVTPGTFVTRVMATDADLDSKLRYSLVKKSRADNENNTLTSLTLQAYNENRQKIDVDLIKDWFDIYPNGTIYTKSLIDRELASLVVLVIGVEDLNAVNEPQVDTTEVRIRLEDINDNYPLFLDGKILNQNYSQMNEEPIYEITSRIEENIKIDSKVLQLQVSDADHIKEIRFKIVYSTDNNSLLSVNATTGAITVKGLIDYESIKWINLTILAIDKGSGSFKQSILLLNFKIEDLNDNEPQFLRPNLTSFSVKENSDLNTIVAKFEATDLDSDLFGPVSYSILTGDEKMFHIDSATGVLKVKSNLDREIKDTYTLVIQASDKSMKSNVKPLTDSILIKISVEDVNDNSPYCKNEKYWVKINQNTDVNSTLLFINGIDMDSGINGKIFFSLKYTNETTNNKLFAINETTGRIYTNKKLIGLSGIYTYDIILNNKERNNRPGSCPLTIMVKDFNAHAPQFVFPNQRNSTIRIKSSVKKGSYILTVHALDPDNNQTSKVTYSFDKNQMLKTDWKSFNIDSETGILSLNTELDRNKKTHYFIDIIATDSGRPLPLETTLTVFVIIIDETNNAAIFDRTQICQQEKYQCEKHFQSLLFEMTEEQTERDLNSIYIPEGKMIDTNIDSSQICYYLSGADKDFFYLNQRTRVLKPRQVIDREKKQNYEIFVTASEHCDCPNESNKNCVFLEKGYDPYDVSQLQVIIHVKDLNDNRPIFHKKLYQVGITSDIHYNQVILESNVIDSDSSSKLTLSLNHSSLIHSFDTANKEAIEPTIYSEKFFPFRLNIIQSKPNTSYTEAKFQIMTQKYLKKQDFNSELQTNNFFQFNLTASDENHEHKDTAEIQIILLTKQQRIKFVFSQPLETVLGFKDEFRAFISNLTGYQANIDKVAHHKIDVDLESYFDYTQRNQVPVLTEMFLHFMKYDTKLTKTQKQDNTNDVNCCPPTNYVISGDIILNIIDSSNSTDLLQKYRLSLAENYDSRGVSTFFKYGTNDYDFEPTSYESIFNWSTDYSQFIGRLLVLAICIIFTFGIIIGLAVCCCMRNKYKKKIKAERALVKAYGLDQRSLNYNDAISGYINAAFESSNNNTDSGLLALPGTNMYAYEGSNPIWLKKYDNLKPVTLSQVSSTSSNTQSSCLNGSKVSDSSKTQTKNKDITEDISSFYLKQDSFNCSPADSYDTKNDNFEKGHITLSSEFLSIKDISPQIIKSQEYQPNDTLLTFATASNNPLQAPSKCRNFTQEINILKSKLKTFNSSSVTQKESSVIQSIDLSYVSDDNTQNAYNDGKYTKIFENYQQQENCVTLNRPQSRDCCDLYEVESTVI